MNLHPGQVYARHNIWEFNKPFVTWGAEAMHMTRYQHYDHNLAYVLLHRAAIRLSELAGFPLGDIVRIEHFVLALIKDWRPRTEIAGRTEPFLRPYADWYTQSFVVTQHGNQPMAPEPIMYHERKWNDIGSVVRFLLRQPRRYAIDANSIPASFIQVVEQELGEPLSRHEAPRARDRLYLEQGGAIFPHCCDRCASTEHTRTECTEARVSCAYCHAEDHVMQTCGLLHRLCKKCFLRGHGERDHTRSVIELWNRQMLATSVGRVVCRLQCGLEGYHYYETPGGIKMVEALPLEVAEAAYQEAFVGHILDDIIDDTQPPGRGPDRRLRPLPRTHPGSNTPTPTGTQTGQTESEYQTPTRDQLPLEPHEQDKPLQPRDTPSFSAQDEVQVLASTEDYSLLAGAEEDPPIEIMDEDTLLAFDHEEIINDTETTEHRMDVEDE